MAFATDKWLIPADSPEAELPEELSPEWDKGAAIERGKAEREQIKHRLYTEGEIDYGNALADCGLPMPLVCVCCGADKGVETACRKRWCPACSWRIQRKRIDRFKGAVELMQWPAFLTLTQQNSADPETVRDLRAAWGRFRRRKLFVDQIKGGVAAVEVTNTGEGWHPHLHAIIDCKWLSVHTPAPTFADSHDVFVQKCEHAQHELSSVWAGVLKQEKAIVWIERSRNLDKLRYSLKYCCKGSDLAKCADAIGPLIRVLDKCRLVSAFGNLHGRVGEMEPEERPVACCQQCGNESSFLPLDVIGKIARRDAQDVMAALPVTIGQPFKPHHPYSQPAHAKWTNAEESPF